MALTLATRLCSAGARLRMRRWLSPLLPASFCEADARAERATTARAIELIGSCMLGGVRSGSKSGPMYEEAE